MTHDTTATAGSPISTASCGTPSIGSTRNELLWWPERGYGYLKPVETVPYDLAYWQKHVVYDASDRGRHLTRVRCEMVLRHFARDRNQLVDIGIGAGGFVRAMGCLGHDVNIHALNWLEARNSRWWQDRDVECMTFWDSLEHIEDPAALLRQCRRHAFVSMPIYRDAEHCIASKHFRPNEHIWYFTERGLVRWFADLGFELQERNRDEERFGRDDIGNYCFSRVLPVR